MHQPVIQVSQVLEEDSHQACEHNAFISCFCSPGSAGTTKMGQVDPCTLEGLQGMSSSGTHCFIYSKWSATLHFPGEGYCLIQLPWVKSSQGHAFSPEKAEGSGPGLLLLGAQTMQRGTLQLCRPDEALVKIYLGISWDFTCHLQALFQYS
jgi:hypothetical protein